jgi:alanine racemase
MNARPVWAEISRSNLLHNFRSLRTVAAPAALVAVVKSDAYGHGAVACSQVLTREHEEWLGVTSVDEGIAVRAACPGIDILAMGGLWPGEAEAALAHRLTPVVWEPFHLEEAARIGRPISVHLEIDTGMSRQGVRLDALPGLIDKLLGLPSLKLDGICTHFHSPEILDSPANEEQLKRFVTAVDTIVSRGLCPRWIHTGNSASLLNQFSRALTDLAQKSGAKGLLRPGLALYGYAPRFEGGSPPAFDHNLKPVLRWKSRVTSLRTIQPGETAGYCATFRATRPTTLALLPVGYADGLNRLLSNRGAVLIRGKRAPIAGRVSMDLTIVDVTEIPGVEIGDEAVLIGTQGVETITAYDHADLAGTIPYEILCNINVRVPRIMVD